MPAAHHPTFLVTGFLRVETIRAGDMLLNVSKSLTKIPCLSPEAVHYSVVGLL